MIASHNGDNLLSTSVEARPRHSFTATALCMIDQRKAASFCALYLCQTIFQLGKVEGGNPLHHLLGIAFLSPY
jgi:hypothetical protein